MGFSTFSKLIDPCLSAWLAQLEMGRNLFLFVNFLHAETILRHSVIYQTKQSFMGKKPFENIVRKGEIAGNQHFFPFLTMFSILPKEKFHHESCIEIVGSKCSEFG